MLPESIPDVFLDTDIAFDIISKRKPYFESSVKLLELSAQGKIRMAISETSMATIFYLAFDIYKIENAVNKLLHFISSCELIHADKTIFIRALQSRMKDKEDALQYFAALSFKADYFITRNIRDYTISNQSLPVMTVGQFMKSVEE